MTLLTSIVLGQNHTYRNFKTILKVENNAAPVAAPLHIPLKPF